MDLLKEMAAFAEATVTRLIGQAQTIDPRILGLVFIFLVVFAAASRGILIFLGATLLAIIAFLILLVPSSAPILMLLAQGLAVC
jgi:type II secretory pathway component PulM